MAKFTLVMTLTCSGEVLWKQSRCHANWDNHCGQQVTLESVWSPIGNSHRIHIDLLQRGHQDEGIGVETHGVHTKPELWKGGTREEGM